MQDPVTSIVASVAGHLALDPHCGQAVPVNIVAPFGGRPNERRGGPAKARFARIRTDDRLAIVELACKTWLVGKTPKGEDVTAGVETAFRNLVTGHKGVVKQTSYQDVKAYFLLGGKRTKVKAKVAALMSAEKWEVEQYLGLY